MKILTLSNSPLEEAQGSGYVIMGYVRRLRERGHEIDVLGPSELVDLDRGLCALRYRQMIGMATHSISHLRQGYQIFEYYGGEAWLAIEFLRRIRRRPLLVAHSNGLEPLASRLLNEARTREGAQSRDWYRPELISLYARAFVGADGIVTVSDFDRTFAVQSRYQPAHRILAIDNPLPDSFLGQSLVHERPPNLVFCGSWIPRKGVDILRRDVGQFLQQNPDWKLILVGLGSNFHLDDHFPGSIKGQLEVLPYADRESRLRSIYLNSRIAIQTSVYESFGLAPAEAMACGCALVASRVGFADSLVNGQEALLFPSPGNPGLGACLVRLARDEQLRRQIATNGYRRVQNLRWDAAVQQLESTYESWIEARKGAAHDY